MPIGVPSWTRIQIAASRKLITFATLTTTATTSANAALPRATPASTAARIARLPRSTSMYMPRFQTSASRRPRSRSPSVCIACEIREMKQMRTAGAGPSSAIASATIVNPADRRMRPVYACTRSPRTPRTASVTNSHNGRQSAARELNTAPTTVTDSKLTAAKRKTWTDLTPTLPRASGRPRSYRSRFDWRSAPW